MIALSMDAMAMVAMAMVWPTPRTCVAKCGRSQTVVVADDLKLFERQSTGDLLPLARRVFFSFVNVQNVATTKDANVMTALAALIADVDEGCGVSVAMVLLVLVLLLDVGCD